MSGKRREMSVIDGKYLHDFGFTFCKETVYGAAIDGSHAKPQGGALQVYWQRMVCEDMANSSYVLVG
jgi:hypothetical protein